MAATNDKYSANVLMEHKNGQNNKLALLPLALQEYQNDSKFRELFKVDAVKHRTDSNNKQLAIGLLKSNNSPNRVYHADARIGKIHIYEGGEDYILLNDGGLNTMADCSFPMDAVRARYANFIKLAINAISAYYADTAKVTITLYKNNIYLYSWDVVFNGGTLLPARQSVTNYPTHIRDLGGVEEGDTLKAVISATNEEGTYTSSKELTFKLLGAMEFIQVYWLATKPTSNTPPTSGTPYVMKISEDMYYLNPTAIGGGGVLGELFQKPEEERMIIQSSDKLQGAQCTIEEAFERELSPLPDGYYYGVPTTYNGSVLRYIEVSTNATAGTPRLAWLSNSYVSTDYSIAITYDGYRDRTTGKIYVNVYAQLSGTWRVNETTISTDIYTGERIDPTLIQSLSKLLTQNASKQLLGTLEFTEEAIIQSLNTNGTPLPSAVTEAVYSTASIPIIE